MTYKGANSAACNNARHGSRARVASDATTGGESGENEGDLLEGRLFDPCQLVCLSQLGHMIAYARMLVVVLAAVI